MAVSLLLLYRHLRELGRRKIEGRGTRLTTAGLTASADRIDGL